MFVITPVQAAPQPPEASVFAQQNMRAEMVIDINVTVPEGDSNGLEAGSQILTLHFPFMLQKTDEEADLGGSQQPSAETVTPMLFETTTAQIRNHSMNVLRPHSYVNGSVTFIEEPCTEPVYNTPQTGYKYQGIVPSPEQLAVYACWRLGYTLNNVTDANMTHTTGARTGQKVSSIVEQRTVELEPDYDFSDGSIDPVPEADSGIVNTGEKAYLNLGFYVESEDADFSITALVIGIAILAVALTGIICYEIGSYVAEQEKARIAQLFYERGADDQAMRDKESVWDFFLDGNMSKEDCLALLAAIDQNNEAVKTEFVNPYGLGSPAGGFGSWDFITITVQTVITLIVIIIIVVVIIAIVYLVYRWWRRRRSGEVAININAGGIPRA